MEVSQLTAQLRRPVMELRGLSPGRVSSVLGAPGVGTGAPRARLGLSTQLFEKPHPLDELLPFGRIHPS